MKIKVNKTDFIKLISDKLSISSKEAKKMIACFEDVVVEHLKQNKEISIRGFGTFSLRHNKERESLHPKTRKPITIPSSKVPVFKISKKFKQIFKKD